MVKNITVKKIEKLNQIFWFFEINTNLVKNKFLVSKNVGKLENFWSKAFGRVALSNVLPGFIGLVRQHSAICLTSLLLTKSEQTFPLRWEFRINLKSDLLGSFDFLNINVYRLIKNLKNNWFLNLDYFIGMAMSEYRGKEKHSYLNTYILKSSQLKHQFLLNAEYVMGEVEGLKKERGKMVSLLNLDEKKDEFI